MQKGSPQPSSCPGQAGDDDPGLSVVPSLRGWCRKMQGEWAPLRPLAISELPCSGGHLETVQPKPSVLAWRNPAVLPESSGGTGVWGLSEPALESTSRPLVCHRASPFSSLGESQPHPELCSAPSSQHASSMSPLPVSRHFQMESSWGTLPGIVQIHQ